jgi:hypothetical protein
MRKQTGQTWLHFSLLFVVAMLAILILHGCGSAPQAGAAPGAKAEGQNPNVKTAAAPASPNGNLKPVSTQNLAIHPWSFNFALGIHGAVASGCERAPLLIDGNSSAFDGGEGYAATDWSAKPPQAMLITFKEAVTVNTVRFLLWNQDTRFYRYKLEASPSAEGDDWKVISDHSLTGEFRGWQLLPFPAQLVRRFRLTGMFNSSNNQFHVVEFQAYLIPADITPHWEENKAERPSAAAATGSTLNEW